MRSRAAAASVLLLTLNTVVVVVSPLRAQISRIEPSPKLCGTSAANDERLHALADVVSARVIAEKRQPAGEQTRYVNNVFVMQADSVTVPGDHRFDLVGKSVAIHPASITRYAVTTLDIQYDDEIGSSLGVLENDSSSSQFSVPYTLHGMVFPFAGSDRATVIVGADGAIRIEKSPSRLQKQPSPLDLAADSTAIIAPFLHPTSNIEEKVVIYASSSSDAVTITWRANFTPFADVIGPHARPIVYDIQAKLFPNGDIRFSYRALSENLGAMLVVNPGVDRLASATRNSVFAQDDPAGDTKETRPWSGLTDITKFEVLRLGNTEVLDFRITVAGNFDQMSLPDTGIHFMLLSWTGASCPTKCMGGPALAYLDLLSAGVKYTFVGSARDSHLVSVVGNTVTFRVLQDWLPSNSLYISLYSFASYGGNLLDQTSITACNMGVASDPLQTRIAAASGDEHDAPLIGNYTVGSLNPFGIWQRLKTDFGFNDNDIEGVGIIETFYTDLLYNHGVAGYSYTGNSGADGIASFQSKSKPRFPSLMELNHLGAEDGVERHELSHRWLFYAKIKEDGNITGKLGDGAHYRTFVDTRGINGDSRSPNGGNRWDAGSGGFQGSGCFMGGYCWTDLYLMGLATPDEVAGMFYLSDGNVYCNSTTTAAKRDVNIQEIIDAMGPRDPALQIGAQFKIMFVLLDRSENPATAADIADVVSRELDLMTWFRSATLGRASLVFAQPPQQQGSRRRSVRH